ncbi:MAG: CHASE2 domain-containing protein [Treponema sp.]|jgi:adenylate cyclase|nr:CHASE2 domain-containing protein [Treponema sp.]
MRKFLPCLPDALIALASALLFSLLYLAPFFNAAELRIYDMFLRFAPRRVMAESLLWLKEFNAGPAIFDIEYIDKSPTQVDEVYLKEGLAQDYNRRFSETGTTVADILGAVGTGHIPPEKAAFYIDEVTEIITAERDALYRDTLKITGDDDLLLARSAALFGNAWGTVNIQEERPLSGEQARRRPLAERYFSYPVKNTGGIGEGENADLLPPIPLFTEAVRGAGFTNITVDPDGVRRRIFPAQEVQGYWYLQLAFAPLMASWGNPAITLRPHRLVIEKPGGNRIVVPLDARGTMLLDWPPETYEDSFSHISFVQFAFLNEYQTHIEQYLSALEYADANLFPLLSQNAGVLLEYFNAALAAKNEALENCSDAAFAEYVSLRDNALALTTELNAFALTHQELSGTLNGKWCVIGRVDTGTTDIGVNPFHGKYVNAGTHAVVLDTILSNSFITPLSIRWSVLFASRNRLLVGCKD